jgi:hypothetical protein
VPARSHARRAIAVSFVLIQISIAAGCAHPRAAVGPGTNHKHERALAAELARIFDAPETRNALWGVEVRSLERPVTLFSRNAHTLMMPASNMKILTLAAAAETLGWDYRFKTTLETSAEIENGALRGDHQDHKEKTFVALVFLWSSCFGRGPSQCAAYVLPFNSARRTSARPASRLTSSSGSLAALRRAGIAGSASVP